MDRRNFLKNLMTKLAAGAALSMGAQAMAGVLGFNKYAEMVRLQHDVITHREDTQRTSVKFDHLLGFAMDNFQGDETTGEAFRETQKMFYSPDYWDTLDENQLREILDVVVPVAVARNLLARHRVRINPTGFTNWDRFVDKYQTLILEA